MGELESYIVIVFSDPVGIFEFKKPENAELFAQDISVEDPSVKIILTKKIGEI